MASRIPEDIREKIFKDLERRAELRAELATLSLRSLSEKYGVSVGHLGRLETDTARILTYAHNQNRKWGVEDGYNFQRREK